MNKASLVSEVARRANLSRSEAARVVDAVLDTVRETVARGQRVSLAGFGTFERRRRNPRTGRNPRTREAVAIPARNVPAFRPGTAFRTAVAVPQRKRAARTRSTATKKARRAR